MNQPQDSPPGVQPALSCVGLAIVLLLLCLVPFFLVDVLHQALLKLHLTPTMAGMAIFWILFGGLINIPIKRIERDEPMRFNPAAVFGFGDWMPQFQQVQTSTILAVNVGGCVVPLVLAGWQIYHLVLDNGWPLIALGIISTSNILVCYLAARPVSGIGITMPGFLSPLTAVGLTWVFLFPSEYEMVRAPIAFVAGVVGPVVGADLLHLRDFSRLSVGMLSIGGAGTFDGIVLSGVLAALLA